MTFRMTRQMAYWMLGASALALAACGGSSEPEAPEVETPPAAETATDLVDEAADTLDEATDTATDTMDEISDAVDEATDTVSDAADDVLDEATDTVEEVTDTLDQAADEIEETVEEVTEAVTSWEPTEKVSAEAIAAYSELTGDADAGRRAFTKCMSCHVIAEGQNRVGPSLYGVVGREAGAVESFRYSDVNANSNLVWTEPALFVYLENPQRFLPGTTMAFPGLPRPQERADLIAYIKRESGQ